MERTSTTSGNHHQPSKHGKIKLGKCKFLKQHLLYLGNLISEQDIQPLPETVIAITNLKEPNNMDELHHFLSLTG